MMWPLDRSGHHAVTDEELSAFADGQLPRRRARRVAMLIRAHPEYADRIHAYWRREAALLRALDPAFLAPVPPHERTPSRRWRWGAAGLAASALLSVWLWRGQGVASPDFADLVLRAYFDQPGAVSLGPAPPAPFRDLDLEPVSRRNLQIENNRLVEYRYRDAQGRKLALYEMARGATVNEGWFHVMSRQELPLVRWSQGDKNYVLVGGGSLSHLTGLALEMRGRMMGLPGEPPPPGPTAPLPDTTVPVDPGPQTPAVNGNTVNGTPLPQDAGLNAPGQGVPVTTRPGA